jgi:DNA-binding CsgD family transcriptional regulator
MAYQKRRGECGRAGCGHLALRHGPRCEFCNCPTIVCRLSPREFDVLRLLAVGSGVKGAAQALDLSPSTIEAHVYNMMGKAQVHSTLELILAALRGGILILADLPANGVELAAPTPTAISGCDLRLVAPDPQEARPGD